MLYILIVWSALCSIEAPDCPTGAYTVIAQDLALSECNDRLATWVKLDDDNRGACYPSARRR